MRATQCGFTLIEMILALGLTALVAGVGFSLADTISSASAREEAADEQAEEADFLYAKISDALLSVDAAQGGTVSPAEGSADTLAVRAKSADPPAIFSLVDWNLSVARGASVPVALNGGGVRVAALRFSRDKDTIVAAFTLFSTADGKVVRQDFTREFTLQP